MGGPGRIWRGAAPHGFHAHLQPARPAGSGVPAQTSRGSTPYCSASSSPSAASPSFSASTLMALRLALLFGLNLQYLP